MMTRRSLLTASAGLLAAPVLAGQTPTRKRLALITTEWRNMSHAHHMGDRWLVGFPKGGRWFHPEMDVVSAYVDQFPEGDYSRARAKEFGFTLYPNIAEALRCGGSQMAVDAVLIIGEHGKYPANELGQRMYPRYEFFRQVTDVVRRDGRSAPVFNDKHLSWKWEWAKEMYDTSRELGFPLIAGSSLPSTWRAPAVEMPWGAEVEEALCVAYGGVDSYDFHALETIQCMVDRRRNGEAGVASVEALRGEAVWKLLDSGTPAPELFEACLSRSHTLAQPETFSHRYPTPAQMREWVKDPVAYRIEHVDGLRSTMLLLNGLVRDFTFAARLKGRRDPLSTLFYLPPNPNVAYSAPFMAAVEETFRTGKSPRPIERTLLTTGVLAAACRSLYTGRREETPHLRFRYRGRRESGFARD